MRPLNPSLKGRSEVTGDWTAPHKNHYKWATSYTDAGVYLKMNIASPKWHWEG